MRIFVGNLAYNTTEDDLKNAFGQFGEVESAEIIVDRQTNRSRGFGFIQMPNSSEAQTAIAELNGSDMQERTLRVNEAHPKGEKHSRHESG